MVRVSDADSRDEGLNFLHRVCKTDHRLIGVEDGHGRLLEIGLAASHVGGGAGIVFDGLFGDRHRHEVELRFLLIDVSAILICLILLDEIRTHRAELIATALAVVFGIEGVDAIGHLILFEERFIILLLDHQQVGSHREAIVIADGLGGDLHREA